MKRQPWTKRPAVLAASIAVTAALGATALPGTAVATAPSDGPQAARSVSHDPDATQVKHDLPGPFSKKQDAERTAALQQVVAGRRQGPEERRLQRRQARQRASTSSWAGRRPTRSSRSWSSSATQVDNTTTYDPDGPDGPQPPVTEYGGTPGPLHNQIAEPDRATDNCTVWQADYNQQHFQDLYFGTRAGKDSLKTYYEKQSSGRYSVDGEVSDWVKVPYNEARYGSNGCGGTICANAWDLVRDGVNEWVADQKAQGRTDAADQGRPGAVRPVGPLRLRRRRQLQRARRLHRPLPDRARRRRRGRRRRRPGRGRHLGAPLVRLRHRRRRRPARPTTRPAAPRSATPASGSATTPSSRRTAASASSPTSTATTSVCRTSTTPPAPARTPPASGR